MRLQKTMGTKFALEIHKSLVDYHHTKKRRRLSIILVIGLISILVTSQSSSRFNQVNCGALNQSANIPTTIASNQSLARQHQCHYYATIPRWPLVCGRRLSLAGGESSRVASFLAIAYAAPPVGMLRFMPPGAPSPSLASSSWSRARSYELMPGGKITLVQEHTRPGPRCVHLRSWLPDAEVTTTTIDNMTTNIAKKRFESEDCLHVSLFVPINDYAKSQAQQKSPANNNYNDTKKPFQAQQQTTISANESSASEPLNQDAPPIWPVLQAARTTNYQHKLPVLVLFSSQDGTSDEMQSASLADKLNSIVINFNYRTGLLGFLPFADSSSNQNQESLESAPMNAGTSHLRAPMRTNHALWDQLGLLHWLKRNVGSFGGNWRNITLVALDNQASTCIQLLTTSSLSKGLFKRAILVHKTGSQNNVGKSWDESSQLEPLMMSSSPSKTSTSNELRQRLAATLRQANQVLETSGLVMGSGGSELLSAGSSTQAAAASESLDNHNNQPNLNIFDVIQAANLSQLARLEHHFRQLASEKLVALTEQPSLDDPLLFGAGLHQFAANDYRQLIGQLDYCLYLKSLEHHKRQPKGPSDFLNLLGGYFHWTSATTGGDNATTASKQLHLASRLNQDNKQNNPSTSQLDHQAATNKLKQPDSQIFAAFANLFNLNLLNAVLSGEWSLSELDELHSSTRSESPSQLARDDDDSMPAPSALQASANHDETTRHNDVNLINSQATINKRHAADATNGRHLAESLGQFQIMFGLIGSDSKQDSLASLATQSYAYKSIAQFLAKVASSSDQTMSSARVISWLRWLELQSLASSPLDNQSAGCNSGSPFAFKLQLEKDTGANWLHEVILSSLANQNSASAAAPKNIKRKLSLNLGQNVANFIHHGNPNPEQAQLRALANLVQADEHAELPPLEVDLWPAFNPLTRPWRSFVGSQPVRSPDGSELDSMEDRQSTIMSIKSQGVASIIFLDLLPYLESVHGQQQNQPSTPKTTPERMLDELAQCLLEINASLQVTEQIDQVNYQLRADNYQQRLTDADEAKKQSLVYLGHVQLECLRNSMNSWRDLTRKLATNDLSKISASLQSLMMAAHQLKRSQQTNHSQHSNAITSRNLVQDDLESFMNNNNNIVVNQQANELELSYQRLSNETGGATLRAGGAASSRSLSQSYKEALGSALGIVIGSGLLILLLNLTVVLIIALRARAARRRAASLRNNRVSDVAPPDGADKTNNSCLNSIQLEPCIRKPTLKTHNQDDCHYNESQASFSGRKQLKFNLSDAENDDDEDDDQQQMSSSVQEKMDGIAIVSYGFNQQPEPVSIAQHKAANYTNCEPEQQLDAMQHRPHCNHHNANNATIVAQQQQQHQHHHHQRCPMSRQHFTGKGLAAPVEQHYSLQSSSANCSPSTISPMQLTLAPPAPDQHSAAYSPLAHEQVALDQSTSFAYGYLSAVDLNNIAQVNYNCEQQQEQFQYERQNEWN